IFCVRRVPPARRSYRSSACGYRHPATAGYRRRPGKAAADINLPRQTYAYLPSPSYAHARPRTMRSPAAPAARDAVAVLTGEDLAADNIGGLICGWMIHSKDGQPMKAGPHPALAQGKVRYVGDHVAVVIAETLNQAKAAAELVNVDYEPLEAVIDTA